MQLLPSRTMASMMSEGAGVSRSIEIVFGTPFSLVFSVSYCTQIMRYSSSAPGVNLSYVGISFVLEQPVRTASGDLST